MRERPPLVVSGAPKLHALVFSVHISFVLSFGAAGCIYEPESARNKKISAGLTTA